MAGGVTGNLKPLFTRVVKRDEKMRVFSAGLNGRRDFLLEERIKEEMRLFLAGTMYGNQASAIEQLKIKQPLPAILESFYYADEVVEKLSPFYKDFLLDSGAFTYMTGNGSAVNWEEYIDKYASFINRNKVEKFIELDIDAIVGYEEVKRLRKVLEQKTNRQPIPVWHKSRGKDEFITMCEKYPYVAIGGLVTKEIKRTEYKFFPWFINQAHSNGAKIHGLGLTNFDAMERYKFDSVDSSSWTSGNRFGHVCKFNGRRVVNIPTPQNKKISDSRLLAINNFNEWVKFANYAERNL